MAKTTKRATYILPTGSSLLFSKAIEAMFDHSLGNDFIYEHFPLYRTAVALSDKNTIVVFVASEEGILGTEVN